MRAALVSSLCLGLWLGTAFSARAQAQRSPGPAASAGEQPGERTGARPGASKGAKPGERTIEKRYEPEPDNVCLDPSSIERDDDSLTLAPEEPPISWSHWRVGGPLPRGEQAKLQAFLAPEMARRQSLTREARCELQGFIQTMLGYHLAGITVSSLDGGTLAELEIEPLTLVRHIDVDVEDQAPLLEWRQILSTVFEADILRRMRLRPGAALSSNPAACQLQLKREEERVRSYLQREGFPSALVRILAEERRDACKAASDRKHGPVELVVHVRKGQPYRVGAIEVEGAQAVLPATIRSRFRRGRYCAPGWLPFWGNRCLIERFSEEELNDALQRVVDIYQKRGYPGVRVRTDLDFRHTDNFNSKRQTVDFTVIVNERRRIEVLFEGHDRADVPADRLRALLTFQAEGSYDEVEVSTSAEAIRRYFQSRGYYEAQVTYERVDLDEFDRIVFTIHPGPSLSVADVTFDGTQAVERRDLAAVLGTQRGSPLTAETVDGDVQRITELYRQRGYPEAKVDVIVSRGSPNIDNAAVLAAMIASNASLVPPAPSGGAEAGAPRNNPNGLYVRFSIIEGPQTRVERVSFEFNGSHRFVGDELTALLGFRPGDPYVRERTDRGRERIGRFYFENAYPRAAVRRCIRPITNPAAPPDPATAPAVTTPAVTTPAVTTPPPASTPAVTTPAPAATTTPPPASTPAVTTPAPATPPASTPASTTPAPAATTTPPASTDATATTPPASTDATATTPPASTDVAATPAITTPAPMVPATTAPPAAMLPTTTDTAVASTPTPPGDRGVEVVYQIAEQERVRFGKVLVHGNFKTRDWVILSELNYREGAPLTLTAAEEGQQNLRASGLFNAVQVRFVNIDDGTDPEVNVVVEVQERHDYWVGLEGALVYSRDDGLLVESALRSPNVFGQGLQLGLRAQAEIEGALDLAPRLLEGSFTVPHWLTRRLTKPFLAVLTGGSVQAAPRLEVTTFWRRDDTPRFGELTSYGFTTAISAVGRRGFWQGWVLSLRYDFRQRVLNENLIRTPGSSDDLRNSPVGLRTGAIGPQLIIDKRRDSAGRPNPLTPEAGFKLELRGLYASPVLGSQADFFKLGAGAQHFWKLGSRVLLTNGARYDHGIPLGASLLPETERFFAGGDTTVRGYEEDRLATEIIQEAVPPLGQVMRIRVLPAGGNIRFIHNLDLQFRLWELFEVPVASAIFLDTGLITNSLDGVSFEALRHSAGVALLRLVAPFGSLSVEYAVPLDPQLGNNPRGRYHVNFGLLF
jgi:outer membrane protein assembly factor BamA